MYPHSTARQVDTKTTRQSLATAKSRGVSRGHRSKCCTVSETRAGLSASVTSSHAHRNSCNELQKHTSSHRSQQEDSKSHVIYNISLRINTVYIYRNDLQIEQSTSYIHAWLLPVIIFTQYIKILVYISVSYINVSMYYW